MQTPRKNSIYGIPLLLLFIVTSTAWAIDQAKGDRSFTYAKRQVSGASTRPDDEFERKSKGAVQILPAPTASQDDTNQKPSEDLRFPGTEYESGAGWWALRCSATCQIAPAQLTVTLHPYLQIDGSTVNGQRLQWSPAPPDGALLFFRVPANVLSPVAGPITTFDPVDIRKGALKELAESSVVFAMPSGSRAYLIPMLVLSDAKASRSNGILTLELRINGKHQTLLSDYFHPDDYFGNQKSYVPWAGDLDGDDKLDLIVNASPSGTCGTYIALFLSSQAKPGELVGKAGEFDSLQAGDEGCR